MLSFRNFTAATGLLTALIVSPMADAAPIGHTSFEVTHRSITSGGAVTVTAPDPFSLATLVFLGEGGTAQGIPDISGFTPILNYLTLTSGVTVDLLSFMVNGSSSGPPGFVNMSGSVILHVPGFDATNGVVSVSGTASDNLTLAFLVEASAVPEPLSMSLLGIGLFCLGATYFRRSRPVLNLMH